ncbi:MAG: type VI secretion system membrane subunit TssM [Betaproteobacteria bacterium]
MKHWLGSRWALGAGAWLAFSAAVWFAGDVALESAAARGALIVLVGAGWAGWELFRRRRLQQENEKLLDGIVGAAGAQDSAARASQEIALLRQRFDEALQVLRRARFRGADGERRTVAELPWYMFIGAPGSGKTTALLNAGLRFPLGDPRAGTTLQGVGGTRNCDWWFTDEAVLLDTAGRYTTQESDREADSAAWLGFLDLLKRFRAEQPLNGAIVTVSVADVMHWTGEEIERYAEHVRGRVWELCTRLGVRVPVYVVVTKTDLLAGFSEFFAELDVEGRAQVWGTTFELSDAVPGGAASRFSERFATLERRLYAMLPGRLQDERDLQRRAAVYRFPQQFRGIGPMLAGFLDNAFGAGWTLGDAPLVRGVYFASGTQEGSPIDRVLGTLARSFNLERKVQPPIVGAGKSFFLKRLLREVVFGESGLAGRDPARERARARARVAGDAGLAGATLLHALAWGAANVSSRQLIARSEVQVDALKRELEGLKLVKPGDEARLVAVLGRARELRGGGSAWAALGLDEGDKLRAQAERVYRNLLRETLLPHLALSLEDALARGDKQALDAYEALYAGGDAKLVEAAAGSVWQLDDKVRAELGEHLRAGLAEKPLALAHPKDQGLVDTVKKKQGAPGGGSRT